MGNTGSTIQIKEALNELSDSRKIKTFEDIFWANYWKTDTMNIKNLLSVICLEDIREIKCKNRANFLSFCVHCMAHIHRQCKADTWTVEDINITNNSVKWLIRMMPVILEDHETTRYFWDTKNETTLQSYALGLLQDITEMLFKPEYCISKTSDYFIHPDPMDTNLIWKRGLVLKSESTPSNGYFDEHRTNLLSLLLLTLSQELYFSCDESLAIQDKWSIWFKSKNNKFSILLFTSLVNYMCFYASELEESWNYFRNKEVHLLYMCLHVLMVCLNSSVECVEENQIMKQENDAQNIFVELVENLHKKDDIDLIIKSLHTLFKSSIPMQNSSKSGNHEYHQECLIILWRMCIFNQKFMNLFLISPQMPTIILSIIVYLHEVRSDPSEIGFLHTAISLLLFLSTERQFGVILNSIYDGKPHFDLPKNSSYNDYLLFCLAKLLVKTSEAILPLHETIASTIYNVSPYMAITSIAVSLVLIRALENIVERLDHDYSSQSCLKILSLLLDSFNNVLCFGFNNNVYIIFCMILSNKVFYKLDSMTSFTPKNNDHLLSDNDNSVHIFDKELMPIFSTKNIIKFLDVIVPQVEKLCEEIDDFDEKHVARFLKRSTIVGIITKPTQIMTRRFEMLDSVSKWIHLYTWTVIYLRSNELAIYDGSRINLFTHNITN